MTLHTFTASGSCEDKELLQKTLSCTFDLLNIRIEGYEESEMEKRYSKDKKDMRKRRVLIFHEYGDEITKYPFEITKDEGLALLADHIVHYIHSLTDDELDDFGCTPSGYEEDYEIGWEIFTPDWYSEDWGIENYELSAALAVKPKFIEYGK